MVWRDMVRSCPVPTPSLGVSWLCLPSYSHYSATPVIFVNTDSFHRRHSGLGRTAWYLLCFPCSPSSPPQQQFPAPPTSLDARPVVYFIAFISSCGLLFHFSRCLSKQPPLPPSQPSVAYHGLVAELLCLGQLVPKEALEGQCAGWPEQTITARSTGIGRP